MALLAEERHDAIVREVNATGSVKVRELAERFGVTQDCIRKDLTLLERQGLLKRAYGGAVRVRTQASDYRIADRLDEHAEEKHVIASKALGLVRDGDTVFLDISTANVALARMLVDAGRAVTIVTNCLPVMQAVAEAPGVGGVRLVALGGELSPLRDGLVGALTDEQLGRYRFDEAFFGEVGVDLEEDRVSTYVPADGATKRVALACSRRSYLMLETRKLHEDGSYCHARVGDFTGAILERPLAGDDAERAAAYEIDWIA